MTARLAKKHPLRKLCIGADLGGSWLRVAAVHADRGQVRVIRRVRIPDSRSPLPLKSLLVRWRMKPDALVLASTGVWEPKARTAMVQTLKPMAQCVRALSDVELAWIAAFKQRKEGILVIAGTGSVIYGRDRLGHKARVGGLGPFIGDEGSAFWIGREWIRTQPEPYALHMAHRPDVVRAIAGLAKKVLASHRPWAKAIIHTAVKDLVHQAEQAARQLKFKGRIPIACHGGLFKHAKFQSAFDQALARSRFRWEKTLITKRMEDTAAHLALEMTAFKGFLVE